MQNRNIITNKKGPHNATLLLAYPELNLNAYAYAVALQPEKFPQQLPAIQALLHLANSCQYQIQ